MLNKSIVAIVVQNKAVLYLNETVVTSDPTSPSPPSLSPLSGQFA